MAVRIRYIYALLIPSTVFLLLSTVFMIVLPDSLASWVSFGGLFGSVLIVSVTAYFGAFPESESPGGRFGRAVTLGICLIGVMMLSTVITIIGVMIVSMGEAYAATAPMTG